MAETNIDGGYIVIARQLEESEIWCKPPLYVKVWLFILMHAQHKDYHKLKRGQLFTDADEIRNSLSWKVGFRTEKPSRDQIYKVLSWLRSDDESNTKVATRAPMIATVNATHGMLITVLNYGVYQDPKSYEGKHESNMNVDTKATRSPSTVGDINKNDKNKKNNEKEHTSKKTTPTYDAQSPYLILAKELFEEIKKNNPEVKKPKLQNWANDMRLMVERDKRTVEKVSRMVKWSQNDDFWSGVVLSASSLRRNYDTMAGQANRVVKGNRGQRVIQKETLPDWAESEYQAPDTETDPELQKKMEERLKKLRGGN